MLTAGLLLVIFRPWAVGLQMRSRLTRSKLTQEHFPTEHKTMCYHNRQRITLMSCSASSNKLEERGAESPRCGRAVGFSGAELKAQ